MCCSAHLDWQQTFTLSEFKLASLKKNAIKTLRAYKRYYLLWGFN